MKLRRAALLARVTLALLLLALLVSFEIAGVYQYRARAVPYETDFHATIWQPARNVLDGITPYPDAHAPGFVPASVYPPFGFLPALPLAALQLGIATVLFQILLVAAAFSTLLALGVRDVRCHGLWLRSSRSPSVIRASRGRGSSSTPSGSVGTTARFRTRVCN